ncbi:hypothetical protein [Saccharothrix syringae]|uniref:LPXTG cell wall anchor domain-containing protein n=1 Tax=Saccharothrix syringae TaxID=103733 RepID=A0A5Q0H290_SACSY|nr:hypothetical protein [Saccharothrix syringae]QFZ19940.1 hypothetical protein EKG83_23180 [Saccharothrix syringae]
MLIAVTVPALLSPAAWAASCAGVSVVVDFGSLGGVRTGCAPGDPASGLAALSAAGFRYEFLPRQAGMVCRVDGLPDPCNGAPTTAYWSYWHGTPGSGWTYSSAGAGVHDPAPGSVEGWSFGAGTPPSAAPPAPAPQPQPQPQPVPQPQPQPPPQPQPQPQPPAPQPTPGQPVPTAQPTTSGTGGATTSAPPTASAGAPASSSAPSSPTPAPSATGGTPVAVEPAASTSSGGTFGLLAGVAAVLVLGGLGWWTARRRARAPE